MKVKLKIKQKRQSLSKKNKCEHSSWPKKANKALTQLSPWMWYIVPFTLEDLQINMTDENPNLFSLFEFFLILFSTNYVMKLL